MMNNSATICVIGATRFVGRVVVTSLLRRGFYVLAVDDPTSPLQALPHHPNLAIAPDLACSSPTALAAALHEHRCFAVVFAALCTETARSSSELLRYNTLVVQTLADAVRSTPSVCRVVLLSSARAAYNGGPLHFACDAELSRPAVDAVGQSIRTAETILLALKDTAAVAVAVLRPSLPFGPFDCVFTPQFANHSLRGTLPILGDGLNECSLIFVGNLAEIVCGVLTHGVPRSALSPCPCVAGAPDGAAPHSGGCDRSASERTGTPPTQPVEEHSVGAFLHYFDAIHECSDCGGAAVPRRGAVTAPNANNRPSLCATCHCVVVCPGSSAGRTAQPLSPLSGSGDASVPAPSRPAPSARAGDSKDEKEVRKDKGRHRCDGGALDGNCDEDDGGSTASAQHPHQPQNRQNCPLCPLCCVSAAPTSASRRVSPPLLSQPFRPQPVAFPAAEEANASLLTVADNPVRFWDFVSELLFLQGLPIPDRQATVSLAAAALLGTIGDVYRTAHDAVASFLAAVWGSGLPGLPESADGTTLTLPAGLAARPPPSRIAITLQTCSWTFCTARLRHCLGYTRPVFDMDRAMLLTAEFYLPLSRALDARRADLSWVPGPLRRAPLAVTPEELAQVYIRAASGDAAASDAWHLFLSCGVLGAGAAASLDGGAERAATRHGQQRLAWRPSFARASGGAAASPTIAASRSFSTGMSMGLGYPNLGVGIKSHLSVASMPFAPLAGWASCDDVDRPYARTASLR